MQIDSVEDFVNLRYALETLAYLASFEKQTKMGPQQVAMLLSIGLFESQDSGSTVTNLFQKMIEGQPLIEVALAQQYARVPPDTPPG